MEFDSYFISEILRFTLFFSESEAQEHSSSSDDEEGAAAVETSRSVRIY